MNLEAFCLALGVRVQMTSHFYPADSRRYTCRLANVEYGRKGPDPQVYGLMPSGIGDSEEEALADLVKSLLDLRERHRETVFVWNLVTCRSLSIPTDLTV